MEKFKAKIKIAFREILNFLTNVLVPILFHYETRIPG